MILEAFDPHEQGFKLCECEDNKESDRAKID
jgi:hypothetical protein